MFIVIMVGMQREDYRKKYGDVGGDENAERLFDVTVHYHRSGGICCEVQEEKIHQ